MRSPCSEQSPSWLLQCCFHGAARLGPSSSGWGIRLHAVQLRLLPVRAAFNAFFLIYASLFGLSIFALIFGLVNLDVEEIHQQFSARTPIKRICGYFLLVAAGLSLIYVAQSMAFIATGQLPAIITINEHPTNVVFALDLTLLIPWLVVGAGWLIKRKPWGYVIADILSVKSPLYTLVLGVNSVLIMSAGLTETSELPLWGTLIVLGLVAGALLFGKMKSTVNEPLEKREL